MNLAEHHSSWRESVSLLNHSWCILGSIIREENKNYGYSADLVVWARYMTPPHHGTPPSGCRAGAGHDGIHDLCQTFTCMDFLFCLRRVLRDRKTSRCRSLKLFTGLTKTTRSPTFVHSVLELPSNTCRGRFYKLSKFPGAFLWLTS